MSRGKGLGYVPGWIYDAAIGILVEGIRGRIKEILLAEDIFPCLDICAGTGRQSRLLLESGKILIGLDNNLRMARYAVARSPSLPFVCGDAIRLPFGNSVFRGIILSFALHDKDPGDRPRILDEVKRVLEPGGRIVLTDFEKPWNRASRWGDRFTHLVEHAAARRHYRNGRDFLKAGGLRALVEKCGFKEESRQDLETGSCSIVTASFP